MDKNPLFRAVFALSFFITSALGQDLPTGSSSGSALDLTGMVAQNWPIIVGILAVQIGGEVVIDLIYRSIDSSFNKPSALAMAHADHQAVLTRGSERYMDAYDFLQERGFDETEIVEHLDEHFNVG